MSPSCCRHVYFSMLICSFLMLSPSFSYAPWRRWACLFLMLHEALSIHLHVSPSISMSPSCCRHVCFLMPTDLSLMRAVSPFMPSVFFYANLSFSYAVPLFFLCSMAQWGRGEGHGAHRTRPDLFWCYPLCGTDLFNVAPVLSLCSLRRFPSISMSLPPSPCLHPVVDMFVFLCPRVFLLCVRFLLLCHPCFFMLICPFLMLSPSFSYAPWRSGTGGKGTGPIVQDPTFFGAILYAELICLMLRLSFPCAP